jgi:[ribosomal protein S5]-alanine N-acetyltransferase
MTTNMSGGNYEMASERLIMRTLFSEDVSEKYVEWLNNREINQYLESRHEMQTSDMVKSWVHARYVAENECLWGIYVKSGETHIGNIRLGPINWIHRHGIIGILIGEISCWGKGYASEAIERVVGFAFNDLKLHRVYAGMYSPNTGSQRAFEKAQFKKEACFVESLSLHNEFVDEIIVSRVISESY